MTPDNQEKELFNPKKSSSTAENLARPSRNQSSETNETAE
jgi:hypothetical protein